MKQGKVLGAILGIVNIILIVICIFFFLRTDRTVPELSFQAGDLTYTQGMDTASLLEGITAYDNKDGDITDRIVIEKMIENRDDNTLIVFYAVSDQAGNVAKASCEFGARYLNNTDSKTEDSRTEIEVEEIKEAGIDAEFAAGADEEPISEENAPSVDLSSEEDGVTPTPTVTPTATPTATQEPTATPAETPVQEEAEPAEQAATEKPVVRETPTEEPAAGAPPVFTTKVTEVRTRVGVRPALVDIIGKLTDDKDSYETLFHNIVFSEYDINTPGTYSVTLSTADSDGNKTSAGSLTIIVE